MAYSEVIEWLLTGDVSIQYQTKRDLLECSESELGELRLRIASEGWGKEFLDKRDPQTGLWGKGIYSPKWISTHYTLLDLKNLGIDPANTLFTESCKILLDNIWYNNGQIRKNRQQDLCVSAMALGICCYAGIQSEKLIEIVDYILDKKYADGGWNCNWDEGDKHSSVHTTLSVLEAFRDYDNANYKYRIMDIRNSLPEAQEFLLKKQLFKSVSTGEIFDKRMLMLSFPCRWKYDILRCLDYFQSIDKKYDERMEEALQIIINKGRNGKWPLQQKYVGRIHFDMEQVGKVSRWNTLRVMRVLKKLKPDLLKAGI